MATVIGSYTYDWGRAIPDHSTQDNTACSLLWTMTHQLLGDLGGLTSGSWTVEGSSDGATGSLDAVNRWWNGGTFLATKMPWSASGANPMGWMVIKSPASLGPIYLLFARGAASVWFTLNPLSGVEYVHCWAARTPFTGGTATTRPTSTTELPLSARPNVNGNSVPWRVTATSSDHATRNCHLSLASDGAFFWSASLPGARICLGFIVNPLLDTYSGGANNVIISPLQDTSVMAARDTFTSAYSGVWQISAYSAACLLGEFSAGYYGSRFFGWSATGLSCAYGLILPVTVPNWTGGNSGEIFGAGIGTANFDYERQKYPEFPIYLCLSYGTNVQNTIKGKLRDMYWASNGNGGIPEGTLEPSGAGPITRVLWGGVWVPAGQTFTP